MITEVELLESALVGLEQMRSEIDGKIAELQRQVGGRSLRRTLSARGMTGQVWHRRTMSAAGRKRIAAAQKKRWAEYHKKARKGK